MLRTLILALACLITLYNTDFILSVNFYNISVLYELFTKVLPKRFQHPPMSL